MHHYCICQIMYHEMAAALNPNIGETSSMRRLHEICIIYINELGLLVSGRVSWSSSWNVIQVCKTVNVSHCFGWVIIYDASATTLPLGLVWS